MGLIASYDAIASEYAQRIYGELQHKPFDCGLLDRFADRVRSLGPVCDLGCGPGQIARYLRDRGVRAFGLDLSSGMLAEAARLNPDVPFVRGDMLSLGLGSERLGGIAAFYSVIHVPRNQVVAALSEMRRVLRRDGVLLLAFHLGVDMIHVADFHGHSVDFDAILFETGEMTGYLERAGLAVDEVTERNPIADVEYPSRRAYIVARVSDPLKTSG